MDEILNIIWQINFKSTVINELCITHVKAGKDISGVIKSIHGDLSFSNIEECKYLLNTRFVKGEITSFRKFCWGMDNFILS